MGTLDSQQFEDYRMSHRPTPEGPGMHEAEKVYPDIHEHPEYYLGSHDRDEKAVHRETMGALRATRGNPEADVTMYRAVPKHVTSINTGDWVTPSRTYAQLHAHGEGDKFHVITGTAKAKHLLATGDHPPEFGFHDRR